LSCERLIDGLHVKAPTGKSSPRRLCGVRNSGSAQTSEPAPQPTFVEKFVLKLPRCPADGDGGCVAGRDAVDMHRARPCEWLTAGPHPGEGWFYRDRLADKR